MTLAIRQHTEGSVLRTLTPKPLSRCHSPYTWTSTVTGKLVLLFSDDDETTPPINDPTEDLPTEEKLDKPKDAVQQKLRPNVDSFHPQSCRDDAPIWGLYLKETEAEDNELTDLWNKGIDTLLIFAGLFAGVITAFLVESRKALKEEPQERLLKEILSALRDDRNSSSLEPFQLEASSLHVNGLWFTSLTLVLVGALWGVLAKAWVAAYNPASNKASNKARSKDACERHLRFIRAIQWKVELVVTSIPLFIQLSLFLFFAGLIIQVTAYSSRIKVPVIVLVSITGILYMFSTFLPRFFPAFPFNTPITTLVDDKSNRRYNEKDEAYEEHKIVDAPNNSTTDKNSMSLSGLLLSWHERIATAWREVTDLLKDLRYKPQLLEMQTQVLAWIIENTADKKVFLEATKAVGSAEPTVELQKALVKSKARDTLYQNLQQGFNPTSGISLTTEDTDRLESILFALIQIEQPLSISEEKKTTSEKHPFRYMLEPGNILHRWDNFEPYLWPLTFSLRVHILISSNEDDGKDRWDQTIENLVLMSGSGGKAFVRKILLMAAIRGLLVGGGNTRQASTNREAGDMCYEAVKALSPCLIQRLGESLAQEIVGREQAVRRACTRIVKIMAENRRLDISTSTVMKGMLTSDVIEIAREAFVLVLEVVESRPAIGGFGLVCSLGGGEYDGGTG
ncbi:hypothetical protein CPB86DRAFT_797143 [Serendipita vermifera]|nr:hypothetical protein CPB86DRAFT_797143 [Serendipita vermifera]